MLTALAVGFVVCTHSRSARAQDCSVPITRANLPSCVRTKSLAPQIERREANAAIGRFMAASPIFPSNPVLSLSGSRRFASPMTENLAQYNWSAQLSQEIEIAGQRGARRDAVRAEQDAVARIVTLTDRDALANAWNAYFELLASEEDLALMKRIEGFSKHALEVTAAAAEKGLTSGVDADVAEASFLRIPLARLVSEQRKDRARAALAGLLGFDPAALAVTGDLEPLAEVASLKLPSADEIVEHRPEVQTLEATRRSLHARASYLRRARFPNPTLSVFVQNDEVNNPVFGVGISFPIPLPQPIGRTYAGEIHESEALSDKFRLQADQARRDAREDLTTAVRTYELSKEARALFTDQRLARAITSLQAIATEIENGRLAVKDAIVSQQTLLDLSRSAIEAKLALCLASVRLARAAGQTLGATP